MHTMQQCVGCDMVVHAHLGRDCELAKPAVSGSFPFLSGSASQVARQCSRFP